MISRSVLETAFRSPGRNISRSAPAGNKPLIDQETVIKDVCRRCNQDRSRYDAAGKIFVAAIHAQPDAHDAQLPFTPRILGWLLKSHLNCLRFIPDARTHQTYPVDRCLYDCLNSGSEVPRSLYRLLMEGWLGEPHSWDPDHPRRIPFFSYKSILAQTEQLVISDLRLKWLNTFLLPAGGTYDAFPQRCDVLLASLARNRGFHWQNVDAHEAARHGVLTVEALVSAQRVLSWTRPI